jgi:hypothetical protein
MAEREEVNPHLKDKAFLTFLSQNPPFELRPKTEFRLPLWPIQVRVPTFQFPSAVDCMVGWRLPAEGEGHTFELCRARPCADGVIPFYRTLWSGVRVTGAPPPFTNQTYDISSNPSHEAVREVRSDSALTLQKTYVEELRTLVSGESRRVLSAL